MTLPLILINALLATLSYKEVDPRGIAYIGALKEMKQIGAMNDLRRIAGTSAGAITAALLAVGYTPEEIEKELYALDFKQLLDTDSTRADQALSLGMNSPTKEKAITFARSRILARMEKKSSTSNPGCKRTCRGCAEHARGALCRQ